MIKTTIKQIQELVLISKDLQKRTEIKIQIGIYIINKPNNYVFQK